MDIIMYTWQGKCDQYLSVMAEVHSTVKAVCSELSYPSLKEKQLLLITESLSGRDISPLSQQVMGRSCAIGVCHQSLISYDKARAQSL